MQHEFVQQELEQKQQELDALTTRIQNLEDVSILTMFAWKLPLTKHVDFMVFINLDKDPHIRLFCTDQIINFISASCDVHVREEFLVQESCNPHWWTTTCKHVLFYNIHVLYLITWNFIKKKVKKRNIINCVFYLSLQLNWTILTCRLPCSF